MNYRDGDLLVQVKMYNISHRLVRCKEPRVWVVDKKPEWEHRTIIFYIQRVKNLSTRVPVNHNDVRKFFQLMARKIS